MFKYYRLWSRFRRSAANIERWNATEGFSRGNAININAFSVSLNSHRESVEQSAALRTDEVATSKEWMYSSQVPHLKASLYESCILRTLSIALSMSAWLANIQIHYFSVIHLPFIKLKQTRKSGFVSTNF